MVNKDNQEDGDNAELKRKRKSYNKNKKKEDEEDEDSCPMLSQKFAKAFMQAFQKTFKELADEWADGDEKHLMTHSGFAAVVDAQIFSNGQMLGGAVVGRADNITLIGANIIRELADRMAEETGKDPAVCMTEVIAELTSKATRIFECDNKGARVDKEGLKNPATAKKFADMVKDLSADDIKNLLG